MLECIGDSWKYGAGGENRTLVTSLEGWGSTTELRPRRPDPLNLSEGDRDSPLGGTIGSPFWRPDRVGAVTPPPSNFSARFKGKRFFPLITPFRVLVLRTRTRRRSIKWAVKDSAPYAPACRQAGRFGSATRPGIPPIRRNS